MHSTIYLVSKFENEEPEFSYDELDNVRAVNPTADYIGDLLDGEDVYISLLEFLPKIMPDFITVNAQDSTLVVADNARERFKEWMTTHVERIRKYQDGIMREQGCSAYALRQLDICTESEDEAEWFPVDGSLFYMSEFGSVYGYLTFIENLAAYYSGQILHIIGGCDYHF